ncbi:MAG TPA: MlaD family protein, partial [Egibacteraceae bacterium]|nr:MlaD family protein [Egibacteraceae bacterium]
MTAGLLAVVFLSATGYLGTQAAMGYFNTYETFTVAFGETGQGLVTGSDVKVRGVVVGHVGVIELTDDLTAVAEIRIEPGYQIPERSSFLITNKTLLGEKQVEVRFDGSVDEGPHIVAGTHIDDPDRVVEFENVLGTLSDLMEAID